MYANLSFSTETTSWEEVDAMHSLKEDSAAESITLSFVKQREKTTCPVTQRTPASRKQSHCIFKVMSIPRSCLKAASLMKRESSVLGSQTKDLGLEKLQQVWTRAAMQRPAQAAVQ